MIKRYLCGFFCLVLLLPNFSLAQNIENDYRSALLQLVSLLEKQIATLQAKLESRQDILAVVPRNIKSAYVDSEAVVASYRIDHVTEVEKIKNTIHRAYFNQLFYLWPNEYDQKISQLIVYGGEESEYDAFVEVLSPEHGQWSFAVYEPALSRPQADFNIELMLHELGHIVAYEEIIGVPEPALRTCHDYFSHTVCPSLSSYLGQFVEEFWTPSDLDQAQYFYRNNNDFDLIWEYYQDHATDYVSDYAATNPEEDFAESLMFYLLDLPAEGRVAKDKIDFMARFSHIREVKNYVQNSL